MLNLSVWILTVLYQVIFMKTLRTNDFEKRYMTHRIMMKEEEKDQSRKGNHEIKSLEIIKAKGVIKSTF